MQSSVLRCPYPETIIDEASGVEVSNPLCEAWMLGIEDSIVCLKSHLKSQQVILIEFPEEKQQNLKNRCGIQ